ncbi:MAG: flavodoxin [Oscillospiraceae bacterium]|nr:flavodoxin [Oscillospiraceae bacterium]
MVKKFFVMCMSVATICLLSGCNGNSPSPESSVNIYSSSAAFSFDKESSSEETERSGLNTNAELSESGLDTASDNGSDTKTDNQDEPQTGSGILVAYFSWSGHTKQLADEIQSNTGGDIFEITPITPYTDDIDELSGIASREQRDNARPQLAYHIDDIKKYDIVFIGYPNWWNNMPMPVFTFLDEYDFSEKTVIPFTSYGNGVWGKSINSLKETLPDATIEDGLAIQEHEMDTMSQSVSNWLFELGIIQ